MYAQQISNPNPGNSQKNLSRIGAKIISKKNKLFPSAQEEFCIIPKTLSKKKDAKCLGDQFSFPTFASATQELVFFNSNIYGNKTSSNRNAY